MRNIFSKVIWWVLPLSIIMLFISIQLVQHLSNEKALPAEGWSRSVSLPIETNIKPRYFFKENNEVISIYSTSAKGLMGLSLDQSLNLVNHSQNSVSIPSNSEFWVDDESLIYLKNTQLILHKGKEEVLAEKVEGLKVAGDDIYFWSENKIYFLNPLTLSSELIGEIPDEIKAVEAEQNGSSILVKATDDNVHMNLSYFQLKEARGNHPIPLLTIIQLGSETIKEISYVEDNNIVHLLYRVEDSSGGKISNRIYFESIELDGQTDEKLQPNEIKFVGTSGSPIQNPTDFNLRIIENRVHILFAGKLSGDPLGQNIFDAKEVQGNWIAEKRGKTRGLSEKPAWITENTIIWSEFSKGTYRLFGASTDESTVLRSQQLRSDDWMFALSDTVDAIIKSLLLTLILLLVTIPTYFVLFIIWKINEYTYKRKYQRFTPSVLRVFFIVTQIYFLYNLLKIDSYTISLSSIEVSFLVISISLGLLAWLMELLIKNHTWENSKKITYFMLVQLLMLSFLIGSNIF